MCRFNSFFFFSSSISYFAFTFSSVNFYSSSFPPSSDLFFYHYCNPLFLFLVPFHSLLLQPLFLLFYIFPHIFIHYNLFLYSSLTPLIPFCYRLFVPLYPCHPLFPSSTTSLSHPRNVHLHGRICRNYRCSGMPVR